MSKTNESNTIKFNKSAVAEFQNPNASSIFLSPIGISENSISLSYPDEVVKDEIIYFKAFHYAKWRLYCEMQENRDTFFWKKVTDIIRNRIITANMSLVYDCIQKTSVNGVDRDTLVSDGSLALISAAESFDPWRGFKFSTYACRSILYRFNAAARQHNKHNALDISEFDPIEKQEDENLELYKDRLESALISANLTSRERAIIGLRFTDTKNTLEIVSQIYNLSKERIRQIQADGVNKLRQYMKADPTLE
jgi:RNA polymerase sigma factor (sigma-70 family)